LLGFYLYSAGEQLSAITFILLFSIALTYLPVLIVHQTHLWLNKSLTVTIDNLQRTITFEKGFKFTYSFDDLEVENHLTIYHKNRIDKRNRRMTVWSNYSYLQVTSSDNKQFNVSSIIINSEDFPIKPSRIRYFFWPFFKGWYIDLQPELNRKEKLNKELLRKWKLKFSDLTTEQLRSKLEQPSNYDELPITAMKDLLKEKSS
jgi:hypothetical protein